MSSDTDLGWPFDLLGFEEYPNDLKEVKRAYARRVKSIDQATQLEEFQQLREAYECLVNIVKHRDQVEGSDQEAQVDPGYDDGAEFTPKHQIVEEAGVQDLSQEFHYQEGDGFGPESFSPGSEGNEADYLGPDISSIDWDYVEALVSQLDTSTPFETDEAKIARIIHDPVFVDAEAMNRLEYAIYAYLNEFIVYPDSRLPFFRREITQNTITLIEEKFEWLSDYTSFRRKFYDTEAMMTALVERHGKILSEEEAFEVEMTFKEKLVNVWDGSLRLFIFISVYLAGLMIIVAAPSLIADYKMPAVIIELFRIAGFILAGSVALSFVKRIFLTIVILISGGWSRLKSFFSFVFLTRARR